MIWKNPFLVRRYEDINSENDFLELFSSGSLKILDSEEKLRMIQFIRSSPGAGKTTLFSALSPEILMYLNAHRDVEGFTEFYDIVERYRIIEKGYVKLLTCCIPISNTRYDLIDEMFQNGRRQRILYALLSVKIVIRALKGIMTLTSLENEEELERLTFKRYPDELGKLHRIANNGFKLLEWAYEEEDRICEYMDNLSDEKTNFTLMYTDLAILKLIEPTNMMLDGSPFLYYTIVIFDDMHKLTTRQRELIVESLYVERANIGIWVGERLNGLSLEEIISSDATLDRDVQRTNLEKYWKSTVSNYKKTLSNIADRRVKASNMDVMGEFSACIDSEIIYTKYEESIKAHIINIEKQIMNDQYSNVQFELIVNRMNSKQTDLSIFEQGVLWQCVHILYRRSTYRGQMQFLPFSIEYFKDFAKNNKSVAKYYLSIHCDIPYYFGIDKVKEISSYNISQYLLFCGEIFDKYVSQRIMQTGKKNTSVSADNQQKYILSKANSWWEDIATRYDYGVSIQKLLSNISLLCIKTRDRGTNPYSGGAATGIAISKYDFKLLNENVNFGLLRQLVKACIESNYLEWGEYEHDKKTWLVLYLNRWICVKHYLPLNYGGWKKIDINSLNTFAFDTISEKRLDNIVTMQLDEEGK